MQRFCKWQVAWARAIQCETFNERGQVFVVKRHEILICLTSGKPLEFKYLKCEIFNGRKGGLVVLKKEHWDSNSYVEGTTWGLYPWAAKPLRSPFMQVKWETNKYTRACNAPESIYAKACNALYLKVHMQRYAM